MAGLKVIPALDVSRGRAVRVVGGEIRSYGAPFYWLERFEGAKRVHVIDIDAALGEGSNLPLVLEVVKELGERGVEVQVGGGLRNLEAISKVMRAGAIPILGTLAYECPSILQKLGGKVIVAVDIREGRVMIRGWREGVSEKPEELIARFKDFGVEEFLITDVSSDGGLRGYKGLPLPSGSTLPSMFEDLTFIYAGGIRSLEDLKRVSENGFSFAVVGRALYETYLLRQLVERGWEV